MVERFPIFNPFYMTDENDRPDVDAGIDEAQAPNEASPVPDDVPQELQAENHNLSRMASLVAPPIDELLADSLATEMAEEIETAHEVQVFRTADKFALRYMRERVVPSLGLDKRQKIVADMILDRKNAANAVKGEERAAFIRFSHVQEMISRRLINHMLGEESKESRGFTALEVAELKLGVEIGEAIDDWYMKWEVTGHDIPKIEDRQESGFTSKWHLVKGNTVDGFSEIPYSKIFPDDHANIARLLQKIIMLLESLEGTGVDEKALGSKLAYYQEWLKAHLTSDVEGLLELWDEVEGKYALQLGRMIAIHPIEEGYGTNETGMIPQFSLRFKLGDGESEDPVTTGIKAKQRDMQNQLPALLEGMEGACDSLRKTEAPPLTYFAIKSGLELVMEIAGQSLPNRATVRDKVGTLATINPDAMAKRIMEAQVLFKRLFGNKYDDILGQIDLDEVVVNVGVHEMGHPVGDQLVFKPSAHRNALEEWKASATEWALMHLDEDYTNEQFKTAFVVEILHAMRYTQKREEGSGKPYYGGWQYFMKTAQELGLIKESGGEWNVDFDPAKIRAFAETVTKQWVSLHAIYEAGRIAQTNDDAERLAAAQADLDTLGANVVVETPFIVKAQQIADDAAKG